MAVPADTPTGTYTVTVTATDGTRDRTATYLVRVDSTRPTALAPALALRSGSTLTAGIASVGTWSAASDPAGTISRYETRWRVDGGLGPTTLRSSSTRQVTRTMRPGHTYALRLRARDAAGNWSAWRESPVFAPTLSQDTSGSLIRKGTWTRSHVLHAVRRHEPVLALEGRRRSSGRSPAGRSAVVVTRGPARGRAHVYIDGTRVTTVDTVPLQRRVPVRGLRAQLGDGGRAQRQRRGRRAPLAGRASTSTPSSSSRRAGGAHG